MLTVHHIRQHLPRLRRYAQALTGSLADGDAAVHAALEAVVSNIGRLGEERVGLYRIFHVIWKASQRSVKQRSGIHSTDDLPRALGALGVPSREAMLLTMLEGFSPQEAATIMGCTSNEVAELVDVALREMRASIPEPILIIEDEPVTSLDLSAVVREMGHRVLAVADTRAAALEAVRETRPALILADIELEDRNSGAQAVREIRQKFEVPTIFITAYPERVLTAGRPEAAYLIAKPFMPERVKTMIGHALSLAKETAAA